MSTNNWQEALFAQALELQRKGEFRQAINLYEQLLSAHPEDGQTLHFLGLAHAQLGDMQQAILWMEKALKSDPKNAGLHNNLANAYKNTQQIDRALEHYQIAIQLAPDYAQAHHNLAAVYASQDKYKQALHHYRQAVHASPDFTTAHFNLGLLLLKNNQLAAAKMQFNNVLTLNPGNPDAEFYLGLLHLEENQLEDAERHFQNVLLHHSEHVQALTNLGVIALKRNEGQLAVDYFTKALAIDNSHLEARNNLAATFIHHDRFENALMHYDVLLKQDPNNIEYLYNSGVAEMALGHLSEAIVHFEKLLSLEEHHFATLNNLAAIYIRLEDKEHARHLLQRAIAANPNDASSRHMLNALTGEQTKAATCPDYAMNLFNNYALYYDQHMQNQLHYNLPQHIARLIHQLELFHIENAIDLGCGTGLTGVVLREVCRHLIGIDIAAKMLAQAKKKGIYDQVVEADIISFLKKDKHDYDLVVAADVLPYFSDLNNIFAAVAKHLNNKGYFIFSTEISQDEPWQLQPTARFSHHPNYIQELCTQHDLKLVHQEQVIARKQDQQALPVLLFAAEYVGTPIVLH
ncbi:tetratricopeptide repeat protein [Legionella maceachernii]|uniref:Methyltransferase n=1 Tax=Legionella maceachernii TaxID=466 RepID=A0A0W0W3X4_9GAMM|nr:tetratricopeptide repeat protein [Legionella maceachernii]KTD27159.1 methyltransferase [Legionella maceachernii]SKA13835.1 Predicted methyltransferase, contains TPR repeat [Legionella maceachernii]SUP04822.1 TPR repeat-containing protein yrrB [Legionella maceachernii]